VKDVLPRRSRKWRWGYSFPLSIGVMLLGAGCAIFLDKETLYLRSAQDHATQEDVRNRLGRPAWVGSPRAGQRVWVYQFQQPEKGGNNILDITGFWCDEYVLTFDQEGILRHWTHKSKKHRDPPTSADCVSNGFRPEGTVGIGTW
jgi:hypothetical protein